MDIFKSFLMVLNFFLMYASGVLAVVATLLGQFDGTIFYGIAFMLMGLIWRVSIGWFLGAK